MGTTEPEKTASPHPKTLNFHVKNNRPSNLTESFRITRKRFAEFELKDTNPRKRQQQEIASQKKRASQRLSKKKEEEKRASTNNATQRDDDD